MDRKSFDEWFTERREKIHAETKCELAWNYDTIPQEYKCAKGVCHDNQTAYILYGLVREDGLFDAVEWQESLSYVTDVPMKKYQTAHQKAKRLLALESTKKHKGLIVGYVQWQS